MQALPSANPQKRQGRGRVYTGQKAECIWHTCLCPSLPPFWNRLSYSGHYNQQGGILSYLNPSRGSEDGTSHITVEVESWSGSLALSPVFSLTDPWHSRRKSAGLEAMCTVQRPHGKPSNARGKLVVIAPLCPEPAGAGEAIMFSCTRYRWDSILRLSKNSWRACCLWLPMH